MNQLKTLLISALILAFSAAMAEKHALLIGIDEYGDRDGISRLLGAENDAEGLSKTLQEAAGFNSKNVEVLKGPQATKIGIIQALERLLNRAKSGDFIFFSFAGHGFQPGSKVFLVPFDALAGSDAVMQNSSLEAVEVARLLGQINADVLVATFDMCRNDPRVIGGRQTQAWNSMSQAIDRDLRIVPSVGITQGPRRIVRMFASSQGQRSWEMPGRRRGYFSWFLEQGLRGEATRNGAVSVGSLIEYLEQEVIAAVSRERGAEQRPDIKPEGSQLLSYVLARPSNPIERIHGEPDRLYKEALALLSDTPTPIAKVRQARNLLQRSVSLQEDSNVYYWLGTCFDLEGNPEKAEQAFRSSIRLNPQEAESLHYLAYTLDLRKGSENEIEQLYLRAIAVNPSPVYYFNLALFYWETHKNVAKAEEFLVKAYETDPKKPYISLSLGNLYRDYRKNLESAESFHRWSVYLDPASGVGFFELAKTLTLRGKYQDAEQAFQTAIKNETAYAISVEGQALEKSKASQRGYHHSYAFLLKDKLNDEGRALVEFQKAIECDPRDKNSYLWAIYLSKKLGRSSEAERLRQEAAKNGVKLEP